MLGIRRCARSSLVRAHSTQPPSSDVKPSIKLVAELRKLTPVSLNKAREALAASNNDVDAALEWLRKDASVSGEAKVAKLQGRDPNEGLIGTSVLMEGAGCKSGQSDVPDSITGAIVELNCETDFVSRNDIFNKLLADVTHTAAFFADDDATNIMRPLASELLLDAPLIYHNDPVRRSGGTVKEAIRDAINQTGEKISISRAMVARQGRLRPKLNTELALRLGSYVHGSVNPNFPNNGRIAALACFAFKSQQLPDLLRQQAFMDDLRKLERSVVRQIVGMSAARIVGSDASDEGALYNQPFMMFGAEEPVRKVLRDWSQSHQLVDSDDATKEGIQVLQFARWTAGASKEEQCSSVE